MYIIFVLHGRITKECFSHRNPADRVLVPGGERTPMEKLFAKEKFSEKGEFYVRWSQLKE